MSTMREPFEAWAKDEGLIQESHGILSINSMCDVARKAFDAGIAHAEAAKATGTAGEPDGWKTVPRKMTDEQAKETAYNINRKYKVAGPLSDFLVRQIWEFGIYASPNPPAEAARHDKDGNHADDLRGMLDELQTEFDKQQAAFWACSEKLAQFQRDQETELSDIRILELAEEDFGEQDDRNVKNEALLSFARKVQAARQPAPVAKPFGWVQFIDGEQTQNFARDEQELATVKAITSTMPGLKNVEYIPVFAALAATAAPVRNEADERDNEIFELQKALAFWLPQVNPFMSEEMCQRIAHDAYMLVIDGNLPDDFKTAQELGWILPATGKVQRDAKMVCGNCMEPIPTTVMDTSSTRTPAAALSDESIDELAKPLMEQCVIVYGDMRRFARSILAAINRSQL